MTIRTFGIALVLVILTAGSSRAQVGPMSARRAPYELNVHVGVLFPSDRFLRNDEFMAGLRFHLVPPRGGWGFGGNFDWVPGGQISFGEDFGGFTADATSYLYSGEIVYNWVPAGQLSFFLGGGVGAATTNLSEVPPVAVPLQDEIDPIEESRTDFMIPLGFGFKWYNQIDNPGWNIRVDFRNSIIWSEDVIFRTTDASSNWELSAGFSFLFGG